MSTSRTCGHDRKPLVASTQQELDIKLPDLGHPDDPGLWDRIYRHCAVGTLVCADCDDASVNRYLYLRVRHGQRQVCAYTPEQVREHFGESEEHHAFKDKIVRFAEREGLTADQEVAAPGRHRQTDVVVGGGAQQVGWEVQLSPITGEQLRKRIRLATGDGLVSSWLTMRESKAFGTLIDRAAACSTKLMSSLEIATADDVKIFQGLKRLEIKKCTFQRSESWHRGLACSGYHALPAGLEADGHPSLARMITMSASGDVTAIQWPRKLGLRYNRPYMWVTAADARAFYDVERPCLERVGMMPTAPNFASPADSAGWHVSQMKPDAEPRSSDGYSGTGPAAILGNQCPRCGWTRNKHRWNCSTGLSEIKEPHF